MTQINPFLMGGLWLAGVLITAYIFKSILKVDEHLSNQREIFNVLREIRERQVKSEKQHA